MTDIPNTHTFKPDYLCDPPCSYHDALQEALQTIKDQADEIERLQKRVIKAEAIMTRCLVHEGEIERLKAENERLQGALLWNGKDLKEFEGS